MVETTNLLGEIVEGPKKKARTEAVTGAKRLKPIDRSQSYWGAIDIEKLIEEDHPARGIWAMVERLDLSDLEEKIRAVEGQPDKVAWIRGC